MIDSAIARVMILKLNTKLIRLDIYDTSRDLLRYTVLTVFSIAERLSRQQELLGQSCTIGEKIVEGWLVLSLLYDGGFDDKISRLS